LPDRGVDGGEGHVHQARLLGAIPERLGRPRREIPDLERPQHPQLLHLVSSSSFFNRRRPSYAFARAASALHPSAWPTSSYVRSKTYRCTTAARCFGGSVRTAPHSSGSPF